MPLQPCLSAHTQDNDAVSGTILIDYENPDEHGQRKEAESRRKEQLRAQKERPQDAFVQKKAADPCHPDGIDLMVIYR